MVTTPPRPDSVYGLRPSNSYKTTVSINADPPPHPRRHTGPHFYRDESNTTPNTIQDFISVT